MNEKVNNQLSAFMDGELPEQEHELLIRQLTRDPAMLDRWGSYHLIRDAMQNHLPVHVDAGLSQRISAAMEDEPEYLPDEESSPVRQWLRPLAGFAVAASVAMMAVLGLQNITQPGVSPVLPELASVKTQPPLIQTVSTNGLRWNVQPAIASRLNGYLVNHNESVSSTQLQGMLHYARIAGYEKKRR
ncbi:MAG TPA: hypothetical protein ENI64_00055 [Gammaproteobacteria bacterium]|nr:hypothetical protein [Gammaproteobacteria bacterium]